MRAFALLAQVGQCLLSFVHYLESDRERNVTQRFATENDVDEIVFNEQNFHGLIGVERLTRSLPQGGFLCVSRRKSCVGVSCSCSCSCAVEAEKHRPLLRLFQRRALPHPGVRLQPSRGCPLPRSHSLLFPLRPTQPQNCMLRRIRLQIHCTSHSDLSLRSPDSPRLRRPSLRSLDCPLHPYPSLRSRRPAVRRNQCPHSPRLASRMRPSMESQKVIYSVLGKGQVRREQPEQGATLDEMVAENFVGARRAPPASGRK